MPTVTFVNEKKSIEVPAGANLRKEAIKAGVNNYIVKPFNAATLKSKIEAVCGS